jgi:hypothetical protein
MFCNSYISLFYILCADFICSICMNIYIYRERERERNRDRERHRQDESEIFYIIQKYSFHHFLKIGFIKSYSLLELLVSVSFVNIIFCIWNIFAFHYLAHVSWSVLENICKATHLCVVMSLAVLPYVNNFCVLSLQ